MKKGLIITFVIVAVMVSSGAFAYAPVIQSIPDIIIGNAEDTATDPNFFRYSNAFAFDSVVTDQDSAVSSLKWCFVKDDPTSVGTITINALGPETDDPTFVNPTNDLRAADAVAEFRDMIASPIGGPYSSAVLSDLNIALYASDGVNVSAPKIIRVTSVQGSDGNTGINPEFTDNFTTNDTTAPAYWRPYLGNDPAGASVGEYDEVNGRLVLHIPTTITTGTWWQWLKKYNSGMAQLDLSYVADSVYVLKTNIGASRDTDVPQLRLRVGANDFAWAVTHTIGGPSQTVGGTPSLAGTDFFTIFEPQGSTEGAFLAIDFWTAAATSAMDIYINSMTIYRIPKTSVTEVGSPTSITDMTTFAQYHSSLEGTVAITSTEVTMPNVVTSWNSATQLAKLDVEPAVNDIYRLTYSISKINAASECDPMRLRINDSANPVTTSMILITDQVSSLIGATEVPVVGYHKMLNGRDTGTDSDLSVALDVITGGAGTDAQAVLHSVMIQKITLPALN